MRVQKPTGGTKGGAVGSYIATFSVNSRTNLRQVSDRYRIWKSVAFASMLPPPRGALCITSQGTTCWNR